MSRDLKILLVEDSEDDARLSILALRRGGFAPRFRRVQDAPGLRAALEQERWDALLADFSMPHFSGIEALNIFRTADLDIPFIFVSGLIGEETAVAAMKAGASDYVMKQNLTRLAPAMERELEQAAIRAKHRQALNDLKLSRDRYMDLYNFAPVGYLTLDQDGSIAQLNLTCATLLGDRRERLRGAQFADFVAPASRAPWAAQFAQVLRRGERLRLELQMLLDGGSTFYAQLDCVHVTATQDKSMVRAVMTDISARKETEAELQRYEQQLRQVQKMESIGTLAGGIAHDFNNILGSMLGNIELARLELATAPPTLPLSSAAAPDPAWNGRRKQALQYLEEIHKSGVRARDLVRQILTFSRHEPQHLATQALHLVVEETYRMLRATVPAGVEIHLSLQDRALFVHADATQLQQVLMNLCTNAWHALREGSGLISIGLARALLSDADAKRLNLPASGPYAHLWVRDNGQGMAAGVRERIFEPFFTTKPVGKGTGLGLAVAHGIVMAHKGAITVDSEPGQGSTFHLYLPGVEQKLSLPIAAEAPESSRGHGEHVIYVDDDETMILMVERMLERAGFRVSVFQDALRAIATVREHPNDFDFVVTDFNMPDCSGLDLAQEMARIRPDMPVVISSGFITDELRQHAKDSGVRELLEKQNTSQELGKLVSSILSREPGRKT